MSFMSSPLGFSARLRMSKYLPMTPLHGGKPNFYWSPSGLPDLSLGAPLGQEEGERCPNPVGGAIAPEQVANGGSRHAGLAGLLQRAQNFVGNRIAERIPRKC